MTELRDRLRTYAQNGTQFPYIVNSCTITRRMVRLLWTERWCQWPVLADVYDTRLIRQAHDAVAVEQSDDAIDQRQLPQDRAPKLQNVVGHATDEAEQSAAIQLRAGGVLHNHLRLLVWSQITQLG